MPDLTTEYYWRCRTVEVFETDIPSSDGKRTYPVTMTASERTGEVWNCPCPAAYPSAGTSRTPKKSGVAGINSYTAVSPRLASRTWALPPMTFRMCVRSAEGR